MKRINERKEEKKIEYLNSGITLIALVVTIIILLILVGITIGSLTGKEGIIYKTITAKNKYLESSKNETEGLNYLEGVIDDSQNSIPEITTTNTHFKLEPNTWTNESVTVTATTDVEGYTLQTSKDASTWTSETTQTFSENGTIYARLINKLGEISQYASTNVTNIDTTKPTAGTLIMKLDNSTGAEYINNTKTTHSVYIAPVNGSDEQSGHKSTVYNVTGPKTLNNQTEATTLTDAGIYSITIITTDNAENTAIRSEYTINIEKTIVIFNNAKFSTEFGTIDYSAWNNWACSYSKGTNLSYYRQAEAGCHQPTQFSSANAYDVTGYKTLSITYSASTPYSNSGIYGACLFGLSKYKAPSTNAESYFNDYFRNNSAVWGGYTWWTGTGGETINIDVSGVSGAYYFNIGIYNYQAESSFNITNITLK